MAATTAPARTVQLFVSVRDSDTLRTRDDWQNFATYTEALRSLMEYVTEEGYDLTPAVDADGAIVYHLAGWDIEPGSMATIS